MDKAIVAAAQVVDVSALNDQLTNLKFGDPSYYLLHRPNKITDWKKGIPDAAKIEKYTHGKLFGINGELRWQKNISGYALIWLSEGELPKEFTQMGNWTTSKPQDIHLLGGGETKPWRDTRIPRELNYPIKPWCKYPCVKVIQYKERNSQTVRFTRYTEFVRKLGD
ncbi:MAG: hypothetical protein OXU36_14080 [Candidatus Poribacteria bacterium]|nr:hypothetical protein [Candidatus Poribacteria bacterium]